MKSEIIDKNRLTNIQMAVVWTLPEGEKFPDYQNLGNVSSGTSRYSKPTYIYIESGKKSSELDFLKYATIHDTGTSWNPATLYGPGIINRLGYDSEAYKDLENVLLPELIDPEDIYDPYGINPEDWSTNIRFFGTSSMSGHSVSLLRFPPDTWLVEFYSESNITKNFGNYFIPSEYQTELEVYPVLRVKFGPSPELKNNPDSMYETVPEDRTESVLSGEYKKIIDELRSSKILAIKFTSAGLENLETFNVSMGAWYSQKDQGENPERHKDLYYLGRSEFEDTKDIQVSEALGQVIIDPLSGILLGAEEVENCPVKNLISTELYKHPNQVYNGAKLYSPHVRYKRGDIVVYGEKVYESEISNNIGLNPIMSGSWSLTNLAPATRFFQDKKTYNSVSLTVVGNGDIVFPDKVDGEYVSMLGPSKTGRIGVPEDISYITFRAIPERGYIMSKDVYSYDYKGNKEVLVSQSDGTFLLRFGYDVRGNHCGNSFCLKFTKFKVSVVTSFIVPGLNYYTYIPELLRYSDYNKTYNSLASDNSKPGLKVLPKCGGMVVSYCKPDGTPIPGATFDSIEGINLSFSPDSGIVDNQESIQIRYHGLLGFYELSHWYCEKSTGMSSVVAVYYRNGQEILREPLSMSEDEGTGGLLKKEGDTLLVEPVVKEAIVKLEITLTPKKIPVLIKVQDTISNAEVSVDGVYINIGESFEFNVFSEVQPTLDLGVLSGTYDIEQISSKTWLVTVFGITESGTILVI